MEGRLNSASRLALSTSCPRYITATSWHQMLHHPEVVGDKQKRDAAVVAQVGKQIDDLRLNRRIEGQDGFIGDDKIRVEDQRPGNTDPLTLAAGKLMREAGIVLFRRQAADLHHVDHPVI